MGKEHGLLRRAVNVKIGALVAVALLVLAMPTLAFAANTASFSGRAPAGFAVAKPTVSVVVYDRYGARGSSNILLYIDGVRKTPRVTYYAGFGYKKFRVSYAVPTALTQGSHTVLVRVKDLKSLSSSYTWKFTVDSVAPVTNMGGSLPTFTTNATPQLATLQVLLSASDSGSGVATVNYAVDGVTTPGIAGFPFAQVFTKIGPGTHTFSFWSVDKAGNAETPHTMTFFLQPGHALPVVAQDAGCLVTGCHGGAADVTAIHAAKGCLSVCHSTGTNDCVTCHTATPPNHATHIAIDSTATAGSAQDCTNSGCHGSSFVSVHGGCAGCHNPQAIANMPSPAVVNAAIAAGVAGDLAKCETCHVSMDAAHVNAAAGHTVSGACFASTCHGTDVSKMHTIDFRGTGATPPGCAACHAAGKTPSTACGACHPDLVTPHDSDAAHAKTVPQGITVTADLQANSTACVACHGTDLTMVALVNPKSSGVPTSPTGFDEHKGCSCHAYGIAGPVEGVVNGHVACTNCHKGTHAPHTESFLAPNGMTPAGGHNTTMFGTIGALTAWDGSQGVVVKDSAGATITQDWPLPTADVFWSQSAKTGTDSPLVAMANRGFSSAAAGVAALNTTVGWGSVITCADCHTNVSASGPQGANVNGFGLDPNFPDDWTKAELTTWDPTGMRSVDTTAGTANPYYTKLWDSTVVGGTTTTTTLSSGYSWGSKTGRFICEKCHKLTNWKAGYPVQSRSGRSQQGMGVSNTAHMEHHPDQIRGQANCISCHVAIPHGWVRPRLLVYSSDAAPYKAPQPSNWFYGTSGSQYLDGIYGGVFTVPGAVRGYGRELVDGGTITGWDNTVKGVEWIAPGTETGDNEGQPNCNACSAAGGTHTPASEGVQAYINLTTGDTTNTVGLPGYTPTSLWK